jgi:hypothetical protein
MSFVVAPRRLQSSTRIVDVDVAIATMETHMNGVTLSLHIAFHEHDLPIDAIDYELMLLRDLK